MDRLRRAASDRRTASLGRMLEPLDWRTTQREAGDGWEHSLSPAKWGRMLSAIINYQNHYGGASPPDVTICRDTGLSIGEVRYHMRQMERRKLLTDVKGFPRHIQLLDGAKLVATTGEIPTTPTEEDKVNEAIVKDSAVLTTEGRRQPFMKRAKQIAQAIVDHYDEEGQPPGVAEVSRRMGYARSNGSVSVHIARMVDLGWLFHEPRHQHDIALTGHGRAALFGKMDGTELHTNTPVRGGPDSPAEEPHLVRRQVRPITQDGLSVAQVMRRLRDEHEARAREDLTRATPEQLDLASIPDLELVVELNRRGFKVSR